jgi:hypothetical protein
VIDWQWLPGTVAALGAGGHSLWLRGQWNNRIEAKAIELDRQIRDQYMHGLQLWPRPWANVSRPLTQVEEITREPYGFTGMPMPPEEQLEQMRADAQAILGSYQPRKDSTDDDR